VTILFLLDSSRRQRLGASVHLRGLEQCLEYFPMNSAWGGPVVFECGRRSVLVAGLQDLSTSLGMAWAIPFQRLDSQHWSRTQRSVKHCAADLFQRRASGSFIPIEMTVPTWPRHACEVLSLKSGCVGGSPIGASNPTRLIPFIFRALANAHSKVFDRARSPSWCSHRWGFHDRLDKISAREKSSCKNYRLPA